jgi:hypothetical protein
VEKEVEKEGEVKEGVDEEEVEEDEVKQEANKGKHKHSTWAKGVGAIVTNSHWFYNLLTYDQCA